MLEQSDKQLPWRAISCYGLLGLLFQGILLVHLFCYDIIESSDWFFILCFGGGIYLYSWFAPFLSCLASNCSCMVAWRHWLRRTHEVLLKLQEQRQMRLQVALERGIPAWRWMLLPWLGFGLFLCSIIAYIFVWSSSLILSSGFIAWVLLFCARIYWEQRLGVTEARDADDKNCLRAALTVILAYPVLAHISPLIVNSHPRLQWSLSIILMVICPVAIFPRWAYLLLGCRVHYKKIFGGAGNVFGYINFEKLEEKDKNSGRGGALAGIVLMGLVMLLAVSLFVVVYKWFSNS